MTALTDAAVAELAPQTGTRAACRAVGAAQASWYPLTAAWDAWPAGRGAGGGQADSRLAGLAAGAGLVQRCPME